MPYKVVGHQFKQGPFPSWGDMVGKANVYYYPNQWAVAPVKLFKFGYGLCYFESLEHLHNMLIYFQHAIDAFPIFKCEVENIIPTPKFQLHSFDFDEKDLNTETFLNVYGLLLPFPEHTKMCEKLMITERI